MGTDELYAAYKAIYDLKPFTSYEAVKAAYDALAGTKYEDMDLNDEDLEGITWGTDCLGYRFPFYI